MAVLTAAVSTGPLIRSSRTGDCSSTTVAAIAPHTDWRAGFLGLATLRPDGFAGVTPANKTQTATLVTQPVNCTGRQLCLSADVDGGAVRAAVADVDAMSLAECTPIQTDATDGPVHWRDGQDLTALVGSEIQLIFELCDATLYSFSFSD